MQQDLLELRFPDGFREDLCSVVRKSRDGLIDAAETRCAQLPTVSDLSWRTDVVIATEGMARVLQPSLLMSLSATDGTQHTFACDVEAFDQLRFGVAKMLADMQQVEQLSILKIDAKKK